MAAAAPLQSLGEALARLANEGDGLRKDDPDRVADLDRLLVAAALEVEPVDRRDGHVDSELDRVVGPGNPLSALHLLGHLAELAPQLIGIAEEATEAAFFHDGDHREVVLLRRIGHIVRATCAAGARSFAGMVLPPSTGRSPGSAAVEHLALAVLIALLTVAGIAALAAEPPHRTGRELGGTIARKLVCAPRAPDPCNRDPLALAYGFPLGKLVRSLAPDPAVARGPGASALIPVDFRRCRRASCAVPSERPGLTTAGRRVTAFTQVEDHRRSDGFVRVTYWLYRPGLGWEALVREGTASEIAAAEQIRLRRDEHPLLVPLETLAGRNHYRFNPVEKPPWRWKVPGTYPG